MKTKIGIFKFSCCAGCEFELIFFQPWVLETLGAIDVVYCKMLQSSGVEDGPFDLALVEGTITENWQAEQLRKIRSVSTLVIPIGSCAVCGGVPAIKNTKPDGIEQAVYKDCGKVHSIAAMAVDQVVNVDGYLKGCPIGEHDLKEMVTSLLLRKKPRFTEYCVCVECKLKYNICVLVAYNEPCMGPVTSAGCGALCPSHNRACYSCYGPMQDANSKALADQFLKMGLSPREVNLHFTEFGQPRNEFKPGQL